MALCHTLAFIGAVNVLAGDECCRMLRVAKGRLPKQALTGVLLVPVKY